MIGRLVILLLAANAAWFAWSQGWLRGVGMGPAQTREPERLERQVRPETLQVRPLQGDASGTDKPTGAPGAAGMDSAVGRPAPDTGAPAEAEAAASAADASAAGTATAPSGGACLQAGVFDDKQVAELRKALARLPEGSWRLDEVQLPGRWMVYVGKLADASAVAAKRAELRALGVDTDRPGAGLEPGLSLGRFANEEGAERALADLGRKGVRTARVVQERRDVPGYRLRLPHADEALRQQARGLRAALGGRELRDCD